MKLILILVVLVVVAFVFFNRKSKLVNVPTTFKPSLQTIYNKFSSRFTPVNKGLPLPGVDCVYVISMPQRKEYISQQVDKLGIHAVYFDAIKPTDITQQEYKTLTLVDDPRTRIYKKYTRFAVLLSFLMCFMDSVIKGYRTIVIFEDDVSINVDKQTLTASINEFNKSDLDLFYMGYCFLQCGQRVDNNYRYLAKLTDPDLLCCHAMCVKTGILPGLVNSCIPMTTNSDEMFRNFYQQNNVKVGVPKRAYFSQNRKSLDSLNESIEDSELFRTCNF
jgi:hypothetical protein